MAAGLVSNHCSQHTLAISLAPAAAPSGLQPQRCWVYCVRTRIPVTTGLEAAVQAATTQLWILKPSSHTTLTPKETLWQNLLSAQVRTSSSCSIIFVSPHADALVVAFISTIRRGSDRGSDRGRGVGGPYMHHRQFLSKVWLKRWHLYLCPTDIPQQVLHLTQVKGNANSDVKPVQPLLPVHLWLTRR